MSHHFDFVSNDDLLLDFEEGSLNSAAHRFMRKRDSALPARPPMTEEERQKYANENNARNPINPFKAPHDYIGIRNGKAAMGKLYVHEYYANGNADSPEAMEKHVERSESRSKPLYSLPSIAVIFD